MSYGDWRDNINPDLLYRYWQKIGKPGVFLQKTPYGIDMYIVSHSFEDFKLKANTFFVADMLQPYGDWKDWSQSGG